MNRFAGYPKSYPYDHRRDEKCKNEELVKADLFWIDRAITDTQYRFTASLKREPWIKLSRAPSSRGFLEHVWTDKDSQRCGLGKAITHTIFKDDKVMHSEKVAPPFPGQIPVECGQGLSVQQQRAALRDQVRPGRRDGRHR